MAGRSTTSVLAANPVASTIPMKKSSSLRIAEPGSSGVSANSSSSTMPVRRDASVMTASVDMKPAGSGARTVTSFPA